MLKSKAFNLKGRLYTLTVINILDLGVDRLKKQLSEMALEAPRLFEYTPVVLDVSAIAKMDGSALQRLCATLKQHGLIPIALQGTMTGIESLAKEQGLALLNASKANDKPLDEVIPKPAKPADSMPNESILSQTKIHTTPVRSGQQIANPVGDLIVMASVSHGAELLAAGNIHIYGKLRGRALAGIGGNKEARVFCQSLDPELISIAGVYRLREGIEPSSQPRQVFIQDNRIQIESL